MARELTDTSVAASERILTKEPQADMDQLASTDQVTRKEEGVRDSADMASQGEIPAHAAKSGDPGAIG